MVRRIHLGHELLHHGDLKAGIGALLNEVGVDHLIGPIKC